MEPYPDERLGVEDGPASPEARYEQRESVELAFTAAMQHLPPLQRAVLIMSDVLGFKPGEVAEALDATPASVYSALQRARTAAEEKLPERSQQETLRSLGDDRIEETVGRVVDAWESADIEAMRSLLSEEAVPAMPPWADWFRGADAVAEFLRLNPVRPEKRWKLVPTQAGGQPALGGYWADSADAGGPLQAEGIIVLTLRDDGRIHEITSFRDPKIFSSFGLPTAMDSEGSPDL